MLLDAVLKVGRHSEDVRLTKYAYSLNGLLAIAALTQCTSIVSFLDAEALLTDTAEGRLVDHKVMHT